MLTPTPAVATSSSDAPRSEPRSAASRAAEVLDGIHRRGDRWMVAFVAAHLLLAFALAPVYGTWRPTLIAGGGMAALFAVSAWRWPGSLWTRSVAGITLQSFAALHIYQMRGLEEMHFFVFTAATMMIAYEDVIALWPGVIGIVAQHTLFAFWHNAGHPMGGMPFFEHAHASWTKLGFHFGIAVVQVVVASFWAYALRQQTIRAAEQQAALQASEARFRAVFDHAGIGIIFCDDAGTVLETNPATQSLLGFSAEELRGRRSGDMCPPEEISVTREPVRDLKAGLREHVTIEKRYFRKDGTLMLGELTVSLVDTDGERGIVGMLQDISERRALEEQLASQALTDPLTGLANRVLFRDRVEHATVRAQRDGSRVAVLLVDLDGLKLVNDGLGHLAGDAVLVAVGDRLRCVLREGDTVARLGGDEFAILLDEVAETDEADAAARRVLEALRVPIAIGASAPAVGVALPGSEVSVGASVGIAVSVPGDEPDVLLRNADVAMYAAKERGKGQSARYEPEMHDRTMARLRIEGDLRASVAALTASECPPFRVMYQPIVALDDGRMLGAEALVRWQHPERGVVSPSDFIPVAEDTGLIVPLGRAVLREACREAATWTQPGAPPYVCVNLSGRQLQDDSLVDDVRLALEDAGLAPSRLTLEITESVVMRDTALVLERLHALKALGVRLAVDDFGTGYSSLAYLQQFPVDVLKIDKRFVDDVARSGDAAALTRTIIALADMLELRTVAEGVEDEAQWSALRALGCTVGQGYLFARPLDAPVLRARLASVAREPATA